MTLIFDLKTVTDVQCSTCRGVCILLILLIVRLFVVDLHWLLAVGARRPNVSGRGKMSSLLINQLAATLLLRWPKLTNNYFLIKCGSRILDLESDFRKLASVTMLRSLIRIPRASLVQIDTEMAKKYAKQQQPAACGTFAFGRYIARCVSALMGLVTLVTFDLLTLKLVCESHLRWGTLLPNLGKL